MKKLSLSDVAEQTIGACALAFPVATAEEVWNLSEQLGSWQVAALAVLSCSFLSVFIYLTHTDHKSGFRESFQLSRVVSTYVVTLLVCAMILALIGKLPVIDDSLVAFNRTVLVAFPASFSATVVDSLK